MIFLRKPHYQQRHGGAEQGGENLVRHASSVSDAQDAHRPNSARPEVSPRRAEPRKKSGKGWLVAALGAAAVAAAAWFVFPRNGGASSPSEPQPVPSVTEPVTPVPPEPLDQDTLAPSDAEPASPVAEMPASAPALPPATATRAELEDALALLESRRDALASQGYASDDPERKPVEEALATLRSRIDAALEEETRKAREAELAGRRAAAQRAIDLQSLSDLKKAVGRRVSSLDGTWTDGEFSKRRKAIADAQKELAACAEATSLARARELRGDIYDAADWIERNTPARAGLSDAERELDALAGECAAADAARLAAGALRKAERARRDAEAQRYGGRYEEAAAGYASAKALFETARNEARAAKAEALVAEARAYGESKLWQKCLDTAGKALEWDAGNRDALALKTEARGVIDAERKAKEEAERKAESERNARLDAERKAKEESERLAREKAEADRKAREHGGVQLWEGGPYWATRNIGAEKPEDSGLYFWWGDTVGYRREGYSWVASDGSSRNFKFSAENTPTFGKNNATLQREGWITSAGVLAPEHDAAHVHWGGNWRMPTKQELDVLRSKCDWTWTTVNGVNGHVVKGRGAYAGASIFLPAAGDGNGTSLSYAGSYGYYWSSVPRSDYLNSWGLYFSSGGRGTGRSSRDGGRSVRPVQGFAK